MEMEISKENVDKIIQFISIKGDSAEVIKKLKELNVSNELFNLGITELETVSNNVEAFGLPKENYKIDLTIANPPRKQDNKKDPVLMTVVPSMLMGVTSLLMGYFAFLNMGKKGEDWQNNIMTIIMCVTMLIASVVWPFVERFYERFADFNTEQNRKRRYKKYLLEKPLKADIALIYADKADKYGNLGYFGTTRNFNTVMALAASTVIVEAEEYIDGTLDPNDIVVPGVLVDHIVVKGA
jgi:cell shape-determining protein MreC